MNQTKQQHDRLVQILKTRESRHQKLSTSTKLKLAYIGSIVLWLIVLIWAVIK